MTISVRGMRRLLPLVFAVAAIVAPAGQAAPKPDMRAATRMALHFQHEDWLYGPKHETSQTRTPEQMMALHFQHEDALYRTRGLTAGPLRSAMVTQALASDSFDWNDALVGAGGAVALMLLGVAATAAIRRSHSGIAQS
jgi:hypothetical protein